MRRQRRIMKKVLGPEIIPSYEPSLEMGTRRLLSDLTSKDLTIEDAILKYDILPLSDFFSQTFASGILPVSCS
jgi:hypothetical protein